LITVFEAIEPPPSWYAQDLLLPIALLLVAAALGGLRTLLASPLRQDLMASQPETRRHKLERMGGQPHSLITTAGLLRGLCVFGAAVLVVRGGEQFEDGWSWALYAGVGIFGALAVEVVPALVARGRWVGFTLLFMPVLRALALPLRPLAWLIDALLVRVGADPDQLHADGLASELVEAAADSERSSGRGTELGQTERRMIGRILYLPDTDAAAIMTPRTRITAVSSDAGVLEALQVAREAGHSRILVQEGDLDHIVGIFFVKDVLPLAADAADLGREFVREHMREPFVVPETMGAMPLFEEMRRRRTHLAVVVDEYGGTAGVVSVEDMVEEIVGEIEDEHDPIDEAIELERRGPDEVLVDGRIPIADLNERLGTNLPEDEDYDTLGGLLFDRFGYIPKNGETVREKGVLLEVIEADGRRVTRVRIRKESTRESDAA